MTSWSKEDKLSCGFHHILSSVPVSVPLQDSAGLCRTLVITTSIHPVFPLRSFWLSMWMFSLRSKHLIPRWCHCEEITALLRWRNPRTSWSQRLCVCVCVCVCVFHLSDTFHSDWFRTWGRAFPLFSLFFSLTNTNAISHFPLVGRLLPQIDHTCWEDGPSHVKPRLPDHEEKMSPR